MEKRPKIKIKRTPADNVFEVAGWLFMVTVWVYTITTYANLPATIPTHYNGAGQADDFGDKITIFILPIITTVIFVGLTMLNKFPYIFNYPTTITPSNALRQYTFATRMIRYLKFIIVLVLGLISFNTIQNANSNTKGLGIWFLPCIMGLIFIPLLYFIVKSFKTH
jgi:uncharacterized membrane protein